MQGLDCFGRVERIRLIAGGSAAGAVLLACAVAANDSESQTLDLWTSEAPIASVLAFVVDDDAFELRVADDIEGHVSGRLKGSVSEVLEPLLDAHQLTVHHDTSTVWFDRRDRNVVARLSLDEDNQPAFADWVTRELQAKTDGAQGGVTQEKGDLVLAGTRAFVQDMLGRIDAARSALGEVPTESRPVAEENVEADTLGAEVLANDRSVTDVIDPEGIVVVPEATLPEAPTLTAADREYLSVSDVPGFDTDYR